MKTLSRALLLAIVLTGLSYPLAGEPTTEFMIVINQANPTASLTQEEIGKIFLKKSVRWENEQRIVPVDQLEKAPVRESFSLAIHKKTVAAIKAYWQRMIFSGREAPPPEEVSDAAVLKFVAANPGAIAYVAKGTVLVPGVKELEIIEKPKGTKPKSNE